MAPEVLGVLVDAMSHEGAVQPDDGPEPVSTSGRWNQQVDAAQILAWLAL